MNRFLALAGVGSRRKNDELIASGTVRVNGQVVSTLGVRVDPARDRVTVDGKRVVLEQKKIYIVFNKPKDCITTAKDERDRKTVLDYVHTSERVYPVGRLDRNTTGVLLLTNDGDLAHSLMHPSFAVEREYHIRVDQPMTEMDLVKLRRGVRLADGMARVKRFSVVPGSRRTELVLSITEGRNREVRRLMEALGKDVKKLDRITYAGLTTEGLARGKWRMLKHQEVQALKKRIARVELAKPEDD